MARIQRISPVEKRCGRRCRSAAVHERSLNRQPGMLAIVRVDDVKEPIDRDLGIRRQPEMFLALGIPLQRPKRGGGNKMCPDPKPQGPGPTAHGSSASRIGRRYGGHIVRGIAPVPYGNLDSRNAPSGRLLRWRSGLAALFDADLTEKVQLHGAVRRNGTGAVMKVGWISPVGRISPRVRKAGVAEVSSSSGRRQAGDDPAGR